MFISSQKPIPSQKANPEDFDVIIIGAGIAGLTAAYFLAKSGIKTIVFERLPKKGQLDHPCGGMMGPPMKNYISFENRNDGIFYKEVDFLFKNSFIQAHPTIMQFISPNGSKFGMKISNEKKKKLIFQIDKSKVLEELANKAENAGAYLSFRTLVSKLVKEQNYVKGVVVENKEIRAKIVISAEGLSRKFTNEAGLYNQKPNSYFFIHCQYYEGLSLNENHLGQFSYFGSSYSALPNSSIVFHSYGYDKALVMFAVPLTKQKWPFEMSVDHYLEESIKNIPYITNIVAGKKIFATKACWLCVQRPESLVSNGFIGVGDSVAPMGHSSITIAMRTGKDAALLAEKAIKKNNVSIKALKGFNKYLKSKLFKGVEFEAKMMNITKMPDNELNIIAETFENVNLEPFFVGSKSQIIFSALKMLFNKKIIKNRKTIKKLF